MSITRRDSFQFDPFQFSRRAATAPIIPYIWCFASQFGIIRDRRRHRVNTKNILKRITADPKVLGGKPVIRGTRLSVEFVVELLASGATAAEILLDYPHLKSGDIKACLEYAARSTQNEIFVDLERAG
jgi:uncharacterized protein (DUF433 family)